MALLTPALPQIAQEFGTNAGMVAGTLTFFLLGFAMGQLTAGPLADRYGRRLVALIFAAIYMSASVLALLAPGLEFLLSARFFQGIGVSSGLVVSRAIVRDSYEGQSAVRIFSAIALCNAIVPTISPAVGAISVEYLGWQWLFGEMAFLGITLFAILLFLQRETLPEENRSISIEPGPILRTYARLLTNRAFLAPAVMMGSGIGAIYIVSILTPFILIDEIGLSNTTFGLVMGLQTLSYILSALAYNRLHGRWSGTIFLRISFGLFAAALALLVVLTQLAPLSTISYMAPIVIWLAGNAFSIPLLTSASLQSFPHCAGAASALLGFVQILYASLGTFLIEFLPLKPEGRMLVVFAVSVVVIKIMNRFRPSV